RRSQRMSNFTKILFAACCGLLLLAGCGGGDDAGRVTLLNVNYDPTRELHREFNGSVARKWELQHGQPVTIKHSLAGSGSQACAVIDGLAADLVTLALAYDIDSIQARGKRLGANWQQRLPENSSP